jgi:hemolysin activation/secretion protein
MTGRAVSTYAKKGFALALFSGAALIGAATDQALAQMVEENPAPLLRGVQVTSLNATAFAARPDDPTPFGIALGGLVLVDGKVNGGRLVRHSASGGIDTTFGGPTAQNDALRKLLAKYVGQPLSFRLLSAIQTDVTQFYRDNGRSLVSVTVPQQEITSGVVQINVTAFVLAETTIEGADGAARDFLTRQVRLKPGQEVDTDRLLDDVNWLNQNPFRHVSVVFAPGQAASSTNLTLQVETAPRTWSGYVGASNAGTEDTGLIRLYGGFNISALSWKDQQLSYQFTGSPESIGRLDLWDAGTEKGYLSHALTYFVPITTASGFRTKLTFGASRISSYSVPGGVFTSGSETTILDGEASFPLPKTGGQFSLLPELYAQVQYNNYDRLQYFFGIPITQEKTELMHGVIGFRTAINGPLFGKPSRGSADIGLVFGHRDTDGFASTTYSYVRFSLNEEIFLDRDRSIAFRINGQTSGDALHPLEQSALGGNSSVRGYPVNGVASPTAVSASIEYRAESLPFKAGKQDGTFKPHLFADFGFADAEGTAYLTDQNMASVGFGGDFEVGSNVIGSINIAHTLSATDMTDANVTSIAFQITARF